MLLFAHIGLTLGAAGLLTKAFPPRENEDQKARHEPPPDTPKDELSPNKPLHWTKRLDWRFIIIGSMLPDIIDKPLGMFILGDTFSNGRIFAHTLLFFIILFSLYFNYKQIVLSYGETGLLRSDATGNQCNVPNHTVCHRFFRL